MNCFNKRLTFIIVLTAALALSTACSAEDQARSNSLKQGTHVIEGYIVAYDDQNLQIKETELITKYDTSRITELSLDTEQDFNQGYYLNDLQTNGYISLPVAANIKVMFKEDDNNQIATNNNGFGTNVSIDNNLYGLNMPASLGNEARHIGHSLGGAIEGKVGSKNLLDERFNNGIDNSGNTPYFITVDNGKIVAIEEIAAYHNFNGEAADFSKTIKNDLDLNSGNHQVIR